MLEPGGGSLVGVGQHLQKRRETERKREGQRRGAATETRADSHLEAQGLDDEAVGARGERTALVVVGQLIPSLSAS